MYWFDNSMILFENATIQVGQGVVVFVVAGGGGGAVAAVETATVGCPIFHRILCVCRGPLKCPWHPPMHETFVWLLRRLDFCRGGILKPCVEIESLFLLPWQSVSHPMLRNGFGVAFL